MAGWSCPDRELIEWDGIIKAKNFKINSSSVTTGSGANGAIAFWNGTNNLTYDNKVTYSVVAGVGFLYLGDVNSGQVKLRLREPINGLYNDIYSTNDDNELEVYNSNSGKYFRFGINGIYSDTQIINFPKAKISASSAVIGNATDYVTFRIEKYDGATDIVVCRPYWGQNAGSATAIMVQKGGLYLQTVPASGGDGETAATLLWLSDDASVSAQMVLETSSSNIVMDANGWVFNTGNIAIKTDTYFESSGSGLPFGSCYGNEIGWTQTNAAQNTWYKISDTDMTDGKLNLVAHDGSGKLTVDKAGIYLVNYSITSSVSVAGKHVQTGIAINGTVQNDGIQHYDLNLANSEIPCSGTCILSLSASQYVEVAIRTTDTGTPNLDVDHVNLTIVQIGA